MRAWLLCGAFIIAEAVNPGHEYSMILSVFMIVAFIGGVFMDIVEFRRNVAV